MSLNVNCRSSEIARSYLDGRVAETEKFKNQNGRILVFKEILEEDDIVRAVVGKSKVADINKSQYSKFNSIAARIDLFKKIVLRGDDSLASLLMQVENYEQRIHAQESEIINLTNRINACQQEIEKKQYELEHAEAKSRAAIEQFEKTYKEQVMQYNSSIANYEQRIMQYKRSIANYEQRIHTQESEIINLTNRINACQQEIEKKQYELESAEVKYWAAIKGLENKRWGRLWSREDTSKMWWFLKYCLIIPLGLWLILAITAIIAAKISSI